MVQISVVSLVVVAFRCCLRYAMGHVIVFQNQYLLWISLVEV